jgi:membrane protein YdbS with pleckstrin-like domain
MRHCANCGAPLAPAARFCSACGAPAADEANRAAPPNVGDDPTRLTDEDATRLARDEEATRVAARSPFDDQRTAPARVQRLGDLADPNAQAGARTQQPIYSPSPPQPTYDQRAQQPGHDQRASQIAQQQGAQSPPRGAAADVDAERVVFSVRPTMLFVGLGYALAALAAIGLTVLLARYSPLSAFYSLVVSLPLLLVPAYHHLRRNTIKYTLTDSKIEIDRGLVARRTRNIPLRNIQDVTVSATIPQRLLGFGDVIVDNASELGGTTVMHNIPAPRRHAEMLLRELRRRT